MPAEWDDLIRSLDSWAEAREVEGGIEVTFDAAGTRRTVEVVLSPSDWEELAWVIASETPETVRQRILGLAEDEPFLVSDRGVDLVPSRTRELPPDPEEVRLQELAARHPDGVIPGGFWSPHPPGE